MSRATFGGGASDFAFTLTAGGLLRVTAATLTLWTAETGGDRITDLLWGGQPVTAIPVGADGQVPSFQGPDGVYEMWADAGGSRVLLGATADAVFDSAARAELARDQAQAFGGTNNAQVAGMVTSAGPTKDALSATYVGLVQAAKNPDLLVTGAITLDTADQITSAAVQWPDGTPGTLNITARHATGEVTAYNITYGAPVTKTFSQPAITRNANGVATNVPAIVVS